MSIWLNLIRKEWLEHRWKLLSLTAITVCVTLFVLWDDPGAVVPGFTIVAMGYGAFAPIFVAMGIAAAEHSQRTIDFVRAQPIALWKPAAVRVVMGAVVLLLPPILSWLLCYGVIAFHPKQLSGDFGHGWPIVQELGYVLAVLLTACLNLYLWCIAFAVNQRTEVRAGMIAIAVVIPVFLSSILAIPHWDNSFPNVNWGSLGVTGLGPLWINVVNDASRLAATYQRNLAFPQISPFAVPYLVGLQGLTLCTLFVVTLWRYGNERLRLPRWKLPAILIEPIDELAPPLGSPRRALLWQRWQESAWQGLACLIGVFVLAMISASQNRYGGWGTQMLSAFFVASGWLGCVLALLLGVNGFVQDLEPKLHTFWRSRPINLSGWFWMKYAAGLLVLVVCLHLPSLLIVGDAYLCIVLLHVMIYSIGVLSACVVRHAVYSLVIAVCGVLAVLLPPIVLDPVHGYSFFDWVNDAARLGPSVTWISGPGVSEWPGYVIVGLPMLTVCIVATFLAATLLRRDISVSH